MRKFVEVNARNIVNLDDIKKFIPPFISYILDLEYESSEENIMLDWIDKQLVTYIKNRYETVRKVTHYLPSDPDWLKKSVENGTALEVNLANRSFSRDIYHIIDYFASLDIEELKKIYKIPYEIVLKKANEWTKTLHKNKSLIPDEAGEAVVREYPDGKSWKNLITEEALDREGELMDHCVSSYYTKVKNGRSTIYSLRNKENTPHCTIEVTRSNIVKQIKGLHDGPVYQSMIEHVLDFLNKPLYNKYKEVRDLYLIDGVFGEGGKFYSLLFPPNKLTTGEDLILDGYSTTIIPDNLTVGGSVDLNGSQVHIIGKNVTIEDNLEAQYSKLVTILEGLTVEGTVNLQGCKIDKLPIKMKVYDLILFDTHITHLPRDLIVEGTLYLDFKLKNKDDYPGVNKVSM